MINEFKYGQTWKLWPSSLSSSPYSTFNINWLAKSFWHNRSWNTSLKIGFLEIAISWFESHLLVRTFKVNIDKEFSDPGHLSCGVLQGSILGLLLFCYAWQACPRLWSATYSFTQIIHVMHSNIKMREKLRINLILISLTSLIGLSTIN